QRRFQCFATEKGMLVDDYAHHPKEILATLQAAHSCWEDKPMSVLFQPHRYSRTQDLFDEFLGCFDAAQAVRLLPVYAASEQAIDGVDSHALVAGMAMRGHRDVSSLDDMEAAEAWAQDALRQGHVVLLMGAGSIGALAQRLREQLAENPSDEGQS
ncbi:MAG: cyanophycin synthetase, partial [Ghiorsea sp.]